MNIKDIDLKIKELKELKIFINKHQVKPDDPIEELVFKKYLELESVQSVADYVNSLGRRVVAENRTRKYISNDISKILRDKKADVDEELREYVFKLFSYHKRKCIK